MFGMGDEDEGTWQPRSLVGEQAGGPRDLVAADHPLLSASRGQ